MKKSNPFSSAEKKLIRRYLLWCYKTTKEELDRIDRYFTQLLIDRFVLKELERRLSGQTDAAYGKKVDDFTEYMQAKEEKVLPQKYADVQAKRLQPDYWYLKNRLEALEKAISHFLGAKELGKIRTLYEEEMTRRIIEARDHT